MKKIRVIFANSSETVVAQELVRLEKEKGLSPEEVATAISKELGTKQRSECAQYRFFRRGERRISKSRLAVIAKVLGTTEESLAQLNVSSGHGAVSVDFDPGLDLKEFLDDVPSDSMTLGKFLIWLTTEEERRRLNDVLSRQD